jgi:DNA-binding transcriptional MocR family regulator
MLARKPPGKVPVPAIEKLSASEPEGGLFIWLELPKHVDTSDLLSRAIETAGVAYVPGRLSFSNGLGHNTCRLSFATASKERIEEGVQKLGRLFASAMAEAAEDVR